MPLTASKLLLIALAACCLTVTALTARAGTLPVQGALRTAAGGPAADGTYVMVPALYDAVAAKDPVWQELQKKIPVAMGFFAFDLGSASPIDNALLTAGKPLWLGLQVGGEDELPRVPLGAVARAWFASVAAAGSFAYAASTVPGGAATGLECTGCVTGEMLAVGTVGPSHVAFAYAGSKVKGGAAEQAIHALSADSAKKSDTSASAEELACSGCVTLGHLSADVAKGFLPVTGGTVSGKLTVMDQLTASGKLAVEQELALGESPITGGHFQAVDVSGAVCGAGQLGRVVTDMASKKLWFCNGAKYVQLMVCTGDCKAPLLVGCGQAIVDDCGNPGICKGTGALCPAGAMCASGKCLGLGEAKETAAPSCKAILDANPQAADGNWWLDLDGAGPGVPAKYLCDMKNGGWTQAALDTFEGGAAGWSPATTTTCGIWGTILGGFDLFGQGSGAVKTFVGLPAHTALRVTAKWARIDSWDGEEAWLQVDGQKLWSKNLNCCNGDQVCGVGGGWGDENWSVSGEMAHAGASVKVQFGSGLDQGPGDESWGVDDVTVWVK